MIFRTCTKSFVTVTNLPQSDDDIVKSRSSHQFVKVVSSGKTLYKAAK